MSARAAWYWLVLQVGAVATGIWAGVALFEAVTS